MLWWFTQNLLIAIVLAGLVRLICNFWRIDPVARHALWLIVLIKLITPPLVAWPWGIPNALPTRTAPVVPPTIVAKPIATPAQQVPTEVVETSAPVETATDATPPHDDSTYVYVIAPEPTASAEPVVPAPLRFVPPKPPEPIRPMWPARLRRAGVGVWIAGSIIFMVVQILRILKMSVRLRRALPADPELCMRVAVLSERLKMRPIPVRLLRGINSPAIWAVARPALLWPAELSINLSDRAVDGLIVHELAHARRRDHWVGWLELLAGCVWWWNPLYWYVRHQVRENAELACDAWVVDTIPKGRRAYAEALLAVCENLTGRFLPAPAVGARTEGRCFLERRLTMILREHFPLRLRRFRLLATLLLAVTSLPAWSQKAPDTGIIETGGRDNAEGPVELGGRRKIALSFTGVESVTPLPPDAAKLIESSRQQERDARQELEAKLAKDRQPIVAQLNALASAADATGSYAQAAAIRRAIQELQPKSSPAQVLPAPASLAEYRGQIGTSYLFDVTGQSTGTIWGSGIYTDDSPLAVAAVHAGVLKIGQKGVVRVTIQPALSAYEGSEQNGIESSAYGPWHGSYTVGPHRPVRVARINKVKVLPAPREMQEYRGRINEVLSFDVTGSDQDSIWGDGVYTDDSALATAAVHAGVLKVGQRGVVTVRILPGQASYGASTANGISSRAWNAFSGSYQIVKSVDGMIHLDATIDFTKSKPEVPSAMSPGGMGTPGMPNTGRERSSNTSGTADSKSTAIFSTGDHGSDDKGDQVKSDLAVGTTYTAEVTGSTKGRVWGNGVYTTDCSLSTAAVHAGALRDGEKGTVTVTILPGQESYESATRNGVTSSSWGEWSSSFVVQKTSAKRSTGSPPIDETSIKLGTPGGSDSPPTALGSPGDVTTAPKLPPAIRSQ